MNNSEETWFKKNARKIVVLLVFFILMLSLQIFYFDSEGIAIPMLMATVLTCLYAFVNWALK